MLVLVSQAGRERRGAVEMVVIEVMAVRIW